MILLHGNYCENWWKEILVRIQSQQPAGGALMPYPPHQLLTQEEETGPCERTLQYHLNRRPQTLVDFLFVTALPASPPSSVLCIKQWSSLLFWVGTCPWLCHRLLVSDCNSLLFLNKLMFAGKITGSFKVNTIMESAEFHMRNRIFLLVITSLFPDSFKEGMPNESSIFLTSQMPSWVLMFQAVICFVLFF